MNVMMGNIECRERSQDYIFDFRNCRVVAVFTEMGKLRLAGFRGNQVSSFTHLNFEMPVR